MSDPDKSSLEFYGSAFNSSDDGETTGTFDLSKNGDTNYNTCSRCLLVFQDPMTPGKVFFQKSGTMVLDATSDQLNGQNEWDPVRRHAGGSDHRPGYVRLTPVSGGACLHVTSAISVRRSRRCLRGGRAIRLITTMGNAIAVAALRILIARTPRWAPATTATTPGLAVRAPAQGPSTPPTTRLVVRKERGPVHRFGEELASNPPLSVRCLAKMRRESR